MGAQCGLPPSSAPLPASVGVLTTSIRVSCSATSSTLKSRSSGTCHLSPSSSSAQSSGESGVGVWAALGGPED
jgi:hypothetical protein